MGVLHRHRRVLRACHRVVEQELVVEEARHVLQRGDVPLRALAQVHVQLRLAQQRRGRRVVGMVDILACRALGRVCFGLALALGLGLGFGLGFGFGLGLGLGLGWTVVYLRVG